MRSRLIPAQEQIRARADSSCRTYLLRMAQGSVRPALSRRRCASAERARARPITIRARRPLGLRRRTSYRTLVGVDNLASGCEPYALPLFHVGDGAFQVLDAQRLPDDHRMQRNAHDSWLLSTVGVQRIELIDDRAQILLARVAFAEKERDIVDLVAIRNREHLSRL